MDEELFELISVGINHFVKQLRLIAIRMDNIDETLKRLNSTLECFEGFKL